MFRQWGQQKAKPQRYKELELRRKAAEFDWSLGEVGAWSRGQAGVGAQKALDAMLRNVSLA